MEDSRQSDEDVGQLKGKDSRQSDEEVGQLRGVDCDTHHPTLVG